MTSNPKAHIQISVVIPTHQRSESLLRLLNSLRQQVFQGEFEVLVVFNDRQDPGLKLLSDPHLMKEINLLALVADRRGVNAARNVGFDRAKFPLVYFLDDDCVIVNPFHLQQVCRAHDHDPDATAIGGGYRSPLSPKNVVRDAYNKFCQDWISKCKVSEDSYFDLLGGNVSYKKGHLEDVDRFDVEITYGGSETEFHARLIKKGHRLLLDPGLDVVHDPSLGLFGLYQKAFKQGRGSLIPRSNQESSTWGLLAEVMRDSEFSQLRSKVCEAVYRLGFARGQQQSIVNSKQEVGKPDLGNHFVGLLRPEVPNYAADSVGFTHRNIDGYMVSSDPAKWTDDVRAINGYRRSWAYVPLCHWNEWVQFLDKDIISKSFSSVPIFSEEDVQSGYHLGEHRFDRALFFIRKLKRETWDTIRGLMGGPTHWTFLHDISDPSEWEAPLADGPPELLKRWSICIQRSSSDIGASPSIDQVFSVLERWTGQARARGVDIQFVGPSAFIPADRSLDPQLNNFPLARDQKKWGPEVLQPFVSVIIPCRDDQVVLLNTLRHLNSQVDQEQRFEVIVVDDGSTEPLWSVLDSWTRSRVLNFCLTCVRWERRTDQGMLDERFRAGLSRNLGATLARSSIFCFLDADIIVPPNFISDLCSQVQLGVITQAKRLMLGPRVPFSSEDFRTQDLSPVLDCYPEDLYWENFKSAKRWDELRLPWKYTCTYCLGITAEDFWKTGGFNPNFKMYGFEDVDLGYRMAQVGAKFEFMKSSVYHQYPQKQHSNFHFDRGQRYQTLYRSCSVFYLTHFDPLIFKEFSSLLVPPFRFRFRHVNLVFMFFLRYVMQLKGIADRRFSRSMGLARRCKNLVWGRVIWLYHQKFLRPIRRSIEQTLRIFWFSIVVGTYWRARSFGNLIFWRVWRPCWYMVYGYIQLVLGRCGHGAALVFFKIRDFFLIVVMKPVHFINYQIDCYRHSCDEQSVITFVINKLKQSKPKGGAISHERD